MLRRAAFCLALSLVFSGCFLRSSKPDHEEVRFEPLTITGDLELEKLNDEELFAAATSYFAAEDYKQAARYFDRICDFFPNSIHRKPSLYNAGLSHERLKEWEEAYGRFSELADAKNGTGDQLDAAFRVAETLYHLERYDAAVEILDLIANRGDLTVNQRVQAQVQKGICQLESGNSDAAETTLRHAVTTWESLNDRDEVDEYYPGQAQFFLGEIYRLHYESIQLDPDKGTDQLAKDLEYKAELLLSAQGHYLRAIRIGNGYWATAAGSQIGGLYENLYDNMVNSPAPKELSAEEAEVYRQELRKKIRVLLSKAITIYERTLEAAERIGAQSPFVEKTRASLQKVKDLLVADAALDEGTDAGDETKPAEEPAPAPPKPSSKMKKGKGAAKPVPHS